MLRKKYVRVAKKNRRDGRCPRCDGLRAKAPGRPYCSECWRAYQQRPEMKAWRRAYSQTPKRKAYDQARRERALSPKRIKKFWSLVDKQGPRAGRLGRCWLWMGCTDRHSYGRFDTKLTYRIAWSLENGPIPPGKVLHHKCENPLCVRPSHLQGPMTSAEHMRLHNGRKAG